MLQKCRAKKPPLSVQNIGRSAYCCTTQYIKHIPVGDGEGLEKRLRAPEEPDLLPRSSVFLFQSSALSLDPERALNPARGKTRSLEDDRGKSVSPLEPLRPDRTGVIRLQTWGREDSNNGTQVQADVRLKRAASYTALTPGAERLTQWSDSSHVFVKLALTPSVPPTRKAKE